MRRVAIIGCGGAGKTTLALELGRLLDLPVVHIDALTWRGRSSAPADGWPDLHARVIAQERWIIEGMKPGVLRERLARADKVVFLDLPRRTCLRGVVTRRIRFRRRPRPETGRPDRVSRHYVRWVWRFGRAVRPGVVGALSRYEGGIVVLRSRREIADYVTALRLTYDRDSVDTIPVPVGADV
jgi:adenylate kinase family enzyme